MNNRIAKYNLFWWYVFSIGTRILLIYLPIITILTLTNAQESDFLIKIIFQVLKLILGILLIFNVFVKPKNVSVYIPEKTETASQQNTNSMYFAVTTVLYISFLLPDVESWILGEPAYSIPWYIHLFGITYGLLLIRDLVKKRIQSFKSVERGVNYNTLILAGKATQKLQKNLNQKEIEELEQLMLVETEMNTFTVNHLGRLFFYSIILALILGVVQEIIGRGYLELAR